MSPQIALISAIHRRLVKIPGMNLSKELLMAYKLGKDEVENTCVSVYDIQRTQRKAAL